MFGILVCSMASCHTLSKLDDGELIGDPLEMETFSATGFELEDCSQNLPKVRFGNTMLVTIIKCWDFESELQRMTVIAKHAEDGSYHLSTKGSAEKVLGLCQRESVPRDI